MEQEEVFFLFYYILMVTKLPLLIFLWDARLRRSACRQAGASAGRSPARH